MHRTNEFGLAAHWAYKQGDKPDGAVGWLRDLIEIVDASHDAEELLEHTRLAIYQDRIFAFTPKGALFQLPKGATAVDFAFAVHTNLGLQTAGVKINGRHMPLRTPLANGDVVEIIKNPHASPQLSWLSFVVTGKARAAVRRAVRMKERDEVAAIGSKLFDEIAARVPARIGKKAIRAAVERLGMEEPDDLMYAIGAAKIADQLFERRWILEGVVGKNRQQFLSLWFEAICSKLFCILHRLLGVNNCPTHHSSSFELFARGSAMPALMDSRMPGTASKYKVS
jgi:GTP pyrophosphokinase